jgi:hypothetical protein
MGDLTGCVLIGKDKDSKILLEVSGKLNAEQQETFKQEFVKLVHHYDLKVLTFKVTS